MLDEKDARIIEILQKDGRTTNVELARVVELTPSTTLERVRKLEERGLIKGYTAVVDPHALNLGLLAFVFMRVDDRDDVLGRAESTAEALSALPSVLELHHLAGEDCFLVKVRARDTDDHRPEDREGARRAAGRQGRGGRAMKGREKFGAYGAWAAVCFFWGTTYLAIRVGLETFPPTLFAGLRFVVAGALLFFVMSRQRNARLPMGREWFDL